MDKLKMHSPDMTQENIKKIQALFPNCVTEARDDAGKLKLAIDFDQLRQELSDSIVEGPQERYHLNWPGKRESRLVASNPITKTLRPKLDESINFEQTKNLFIEGDNLEALKLLQQSYLQKIKLIYIDPPYNTGKDFVYRDDFSADRNEFLTQSQQHDEEGNRLVANRDSSGRFHSQWLSMMYSRLLMARNLLRRDGIVVISIDEKEHANLKKLCDEVFGANNFCGEIVWKNSSKNDQAYVSIQHEYLVVYVRDKSENPGDWTEKKQGLDEIYKAFEGFKKEFGDDWDAIHKAALKWYKNFPPSNPISDSKHYSWMDERGVYFPDNIAGPNDGQYVYDVIHPVTGEICKQPSTGWRYPKETMLKRVEDNRIHFGKDHTTVPNNKTYLRSTEYQSLTSMRYADGRAASNRLKALFGEKVFTNPKDELLLAELFNAMQVKGDDIVLDFFAGSGTTAHAVYEMNRKYGHNCQYILVQIQEDLNEALKLATGGAKKVTKNAIKYLTRLGRPTTVSEITKQRLILVAKQIQENDIHESWNGDTGFRVFAIDSSNMNDVYYLPSKLKQGDLLNSVSHIKEERSGVDLLFQVLIDWGLELCASVKQKTVFGHEVFFVDDNALVCCLSDNVSKELLVEILTYKPLRMVVREDSYLDDPQKISIEQLVKQLSPVTELKEI